MEPPDLATVIREIAEGIPNISSFYQINLGSSDDIDRVVTIAEQMLLNATPLDTDQPLATA